MPFCSDRIAVCSLDHRAYQLGGLLGVIGFHAQQHDVGGCMAFERLHRIGLDAPLAIDRRADAHAMFADRLQMRAACDEGDVFACPRKPSTEIAAYAATAYD